jgi:hypothetical protein
VPSISPSEWPFSDYRDPMVVAAMSGQGRGWVDPLRAPLDHEDSIEATLRTTEYQHILNFVTVDMYKGICPHSRRSKALSFRELL